MGCPERMNDMLKKLLLFCLVFSITSVGCLALAESVPELLEPAGIELDYAQAQKMDLYTVTPYAASVVPYTEDLSFAVDGVVEQTHVSLGSSVKAGDKLITLNEEALLEQEAELKEQISYTRKIHIYANEMAQIDIQIAQVKLDEMKDSGADEAAIIQAQANIDMMELKLRQAKEEQALSVKKMESELEKITEQIGQNVLLAPFDGVIVSIADLREEYGVTAYEPVIRIADESHMLILSDYISQNTIKGAHEIYALIGDQKHAVEYVPIDMDEYLQTIFAEATLKTKFEFAAEHAEVCCGDYASVCTVTGFVEDALVIPCNALYSDSAGRYVYRLDGEGQRERVNVHTGSSNMLYIQITEGLEEGDLVYVKE